MPSSLIVNKEFKNASMANVFHCDNNVRVYAVGFVNPSCNESVTYDIYLLNKNYKSPVDGKKISSVTQKYPYAGYHRVYLDDPVYIPKGADYSVVATVTEENSSNCVTFKVGTNRAYAEMLAQQQKQAYIAAHGSDEGFEPTKITYNKGVVNKGESFVTAGGEWYDWKDVIDCYQTAAQYFEVDNFSIQSYTDCEVATVVNSLGEKDKQPYKVGDKVCGTVSLTCNVDGGHSFDVYINGKLIGKTDVLQLGKTAQLKYELTASEQDAENGFIKSVVTVFFEQDSIKRELELFDRSSITTATAKVAATNDSSKPVDSSTPTNSDTDSASASSDNGNETIKNPDTGAKHNTAATLVIIGFVVLIAAASVITSKKDKDS